MIRSRRTTQAVDEPFVIDTDALGLHLLRGAAVATCARAQWGKAGLRTLVPRTAPPGDDAGAVAEWLVGHYPAGPYPGVVIGSPHAGAVHLALMLGVPWLPAGFDVAVPASRRRSTGWPAPAGPDLALRVGREAAQAQPKLAIRCGYDPLARRYADSVWLTVRWMTLPAAYRAFIADEVAPGAPVILARDIGRWLIVRDGRVTVQVGRRAGGLSAEDYELGSARLRVARRRAGAGNSLLPYRLPSSGTGVCEGDGEHAVDAGLIADLRRWTTQVGRPLRQIVYSSADAFSGAVADLHRDWLRRSDRPADRLVVECGRLADPWQILRAGLVPYWCEHPLGSAVDALTWWLAGSSPFAEIEAFVEPPGLMLPDVPEVERWVAMTKFAVRRSRLDRRCAKAYPLGTVAAMHAGQVLRGYPSQWPCPPLLAPEDALAALSSGAETSGLLVA